MKNGKKERHIQARKRWQHLHAKLNYNAPCLTDRHGVQSKLDLRNTIKTGVVKRCTRVILEFFSGPGKPLEKVETGRKVVGMLKPYRASWGIGTDHG